MKLSQANRAAHDVLEAQLLDMLGAAVDGRVTASRASLGQLRAHFEAHLAAEEAHTLPLLRDLGGPLTKLALIVDGDHRILHRSLQGASDLLDGLPDGPEGRAAVLGHIEVFSKLKTVLEHHGVREQEDVYSPLDKRFPQLEWASELLLTPTPPTEEAQ